MNLKIKTYGALCSLEIFTINGIDADYEDFGDKYDHSPETADAYCCGDMRFDPFDNVNWPILKKYNITEDEYFEICSKLENELSWGSCGWCL